MLLHIHKRGVKKRSDVTHLQKRSEEEKRNAKVTRKECRRDSMSSEKEKKGIKKRGDVIRKEKERNEQEKRNARVNKL